MSACSRRRQLEPVRSWPPAAACRRCRGCRRRGRGRGIPEIGRIKGRPRLLAGNADEREQRVAASIG